MNAPSRESEAPETTVSDTSKDKGGTLICDLIRAGITSRQQLASNWKTIASYHRNEAPPQSVAPSPDMPAIRRPLLSIRIDNTAASIVNVLGRLDPIMLAHTGTGNTDSSSAQEILHKAWIQGGYIDILYKVVQNALLFNKGCFRIKLGAKAEGHDDEGFGNVDTLFKGPKFNYLGLVFESIAPTDLVIAPAVNIEDAALVGHRFWMKASTIREKIAAGVYNKGKPRTNLVAGDPGNSEDSLDENSNTDYGIFSSWPETEQVECFEGIIKKCPPGSKFTKPYRFVVAKESDTLLHEEPWVHAYTGYFDTQVEDDPGNDSCWPERSIGRDLVPAQDEYDRHASLFYAGAQMSALKPIVGPEQLGEKTTYYHPGEYVEVEMTDGKVWTPDLSFDGQAIIRAMGDIERNADIVARSSVNAQGETAKGEPTATEINQVTAAVSVGVDDLILRFVQCYPRMAAHSMELLSYAWTPYSALWGYADEDVPPVLLRHPTIWTVSGTSQADLPMAQFAKGMQILQLAADPRSGVNIFKLTGFILKASGYTGIEDAQIRLTPQEMEQYEAMQKEAMLGGGQGTQPPNPPGAGPSGQPPPPRAVSGIPGHAKLSLPAQITDQRQALPPSVESAGRPSGSSAPPG